MIFLRFFLKNLYSVLLILIFSNFRVTALGPQWKEQLFSIYSDAESINFGIARNRLKITSSLYDFKKGYTLQVNGEEGFLTAVTVSKALKKSLEELLEKYRNINIEGRQILRLDHDRVHPIYVYKEPEKGIYIGFSFETPNQEMFDAIDRVYVNYPATAEIVKNHYRMNHVIRILHASNFHSNQEPPSINDIMFCATLIGEKEQQLYGIHDAQDYLSNLKQLVKESADYKLLTNEELPLENSSGA